MAEDVAPARTVVRPDDKDVRQTERFAVRRRTAVDERAGASLTLPRVEPDGVVDKTEVSMDVEVSWAVALAVEWSRWPFEERATAGGRRDFVEVVGGARPPKAFQPRLKLEARLQCLVR